jgi:hypothetical protein
MGLTLEEANRILRGTLAKAQELNIKISAAICDPGGRPIALQRMDNTMWASAYAPKARPSSRRHSAAPAAKWPSVPTCQHCAGLRRRRAAT